MCFGSLPVVLAMPALAVRGCMTPVQSIQVRSQLRQRISIGAKICKATLSHSIPSPQGLIRPILVIVQFHSKYSSLTPLVHPLVRFSSTTNDSLDIHVTMTMLDQGCNSGLAMAQAFSAAPSRPALKSEAHERFLLYVSAPPRSTNPHYSIRSFFPRR